MLWYCGRNIVIFVHCFSFQKPKDHPLITKTRFRSLYKHVRQIQNNKFSVKQENEWKQTKLKLLWTWDRHFLILFHEHHINNQIWLLVDESSYHRCLLIVLFIFFGMVLFQFWVFFYVFFSSPIQSVLFFNLI
jgi:hypothetical protein